MKSLFLLISTIFLLTHSAEVNETKISTDETQFIQVEPQPLVDLEKIKNSTKDAADRIYKIITANKEHTDTTTEQPELKIHQHPLFNLHSNNRQEHKPFSIFGLHKSPESSKTIKSSSSSFEEPLCTCRSEYSIPSYIESTPSSFRPSRPISSSSSSSSFNSRNLPTFEVVYPSSSKDFFSNNVETQIQFESSQYPPLDLSDLWKYQESSIQSSLNDNL